MKRVIISCATVLSVCIQIVCMQTASSHASVAEVEAFVTRFYQQCLNRNPDQAGLDYWTNSLLSGCLTGADVAHGFVFSTEFTNLNTSDAEYLTVLYTAFFDRNPDSGGYDYWLSQLNRGVSREEVLDGFIYAQEFVDLCDSYGIIAFRTDPRALVEAFVTRFYQQCLSRSPDPGGLAYWVDSLLDGSLTGSDVAWGFVFSQEFVEFNATNEEYLTVLYRAFFDRQPDPGGFAYWLSELTSGVSREDVLDGFVYAQEFENLCGLFGIIPYPITPYTKLPETGQTTCYNASGSVIACLNTGQDGDILAGVSWPTPRFTDNGDGTATDDLTGLMWLKDGNCFETQPWANALTTVDDFNANPCAYGCQDYTGNYNDWRLPNINELESLVNVEEASQAIWLAGQGFTDVQSGNYWSSTTDATATEDYAWRINMEDGRTTFGGKGCGLCNLWPVRAATSPPAQLWKTGQTTSYAAGDDGDLQRGIAWPLPRFTNNGDGTITDNLTVLIWTGDANAPGPAGCTTGVTMRWQDALGYVACINTSNYLGYNDWRLPNRKELHSLTDFSQSIPALPADYLTYFTNVQSDYYWSSTTYAATPTSAWVVDLYDGYVYGQSKANSNYVRCVRGGQ